MGDKGNLGIRKEYFTAEDLTFKKFFFFLDDSSTTIEATEVALLITLVRNVYSILTRKSLLTFPDIELSSFSFKIL